MSATCEKCKGFGETLRGTGIYDCQAPGCTAAVDRTALEESLPAAEVCHPLDTLWVGYMEGRSVALEEAAQIAETTWVQPGDIGCENCHEAADAIRALK